MTPSVRHHKTTILITGPQCKNGREVHLCTYGIGINVFHNPNMLRFRADTANREFLMQTPNMLTLHSFSYANCSAPGSERLYAVQQQPTLWTLSFRIQSARPQTNQEHRLVQLAHGPWATPKASLFMHVLFARRNLEESG